jgi:cell division protein FtsL
MSPTERIADLEQIIKTQQTEIDRLLTELLKLCDSRRDWMAKCIAARQDLQAEKQRHWNMEEKSLKKRA